MPVVKQEKLDGSGLDKLLDDLQGLRCDRHDRWICERLAAITAGVLEHASDQQTARLISLITKQLPLCTSLLPSAKDSTASTSSSQAPAKELAKHLLHVLCQAWGLAAQQLGPLMLDKSVGQPLLTTVAGGCSSWCASGAC
ncbi:hypothetical protein OEZ86_004118 [Tetradesmus obliquus]|nr:hypothetical protein OEZ86_004118 [Tetradesmus obliquus]